MKYRISGQVTISCYTDVEANSEEEARKIASDREMQMVNSAERSGQSSDEVWCHSGELDGTPEISYVDLNED